MARQKTRKRATKQSKSRRQRHVFAYPLFIFLLLCAGVFLIAWTLRAGADSVFVSAKVSAPFVTQPATITTPTNGTHFSATPIDVRGVCPPNAGYVEIFDNNVMAGSAICQSDNSFALSVNLVPGANNLVAHVFNITDDEGPASSAINVIYDVPKPPPTPAQNNSPVASSPFLLETAFLYKGYKIGQQVEWPIEIVGGNAPYAVSVDWGDGTSDLISRSQSGQFTINHTYSSLPADNKNSYTIQVKGTDAQAKSAYIQFFVIVTSNIGQTTGSIFSKPTPSLGFPRWLLIAWPAYTLAVLMSVSYLLGEREELLILRKKGQLRR